MANDLRVYERLVALKLPHDTADQWKRVTAIFWGSSGRRFKPCQPDQCDVSGTVPADTVSPTRRRARSSSPTSTAYCNAAVVYIQPAGVRVRGTN